MDKKKIYVISSKNNPQIADTTTRRIQGGRVEINRPAAIKQYNQTKGGVDLADQYISYNRIAFKRRKRWWLTLYHQVLNIIIENARILFELSTGQKISSRAFRIRLAMELLEFKENSNPTQPVFGHIYLRHEQEDGKRRKRKRCRNCYKIEKKDTRTTKSCSSCGPLCENCYQHLHSNPDLLNEYFVENSNGDDDDQEYDQYADNSDDDQEYGDQEYDDQEDDDQEDDD